MLEKYFLLAGLRAPDRCLRENCRAAWSAPVWSLTVCCLLEERPNPTAFHTHTQKKSLNLCVLLPGKWSLKTLMRVLEAAAVSEESCFWNETKFKQRLTFDGHHHLFWKDTPHVPWLSLLTWCCSCLGSFPQSLVTSLCNGVGLLPHVFLAWGDDDKVL